MTKKIDDCMIDEITALFMDVFTREPWNDKWVSFEDTKAYITDLTGNRNSLGFAYLIDEKICGLSLGYVFNWYSGREYYIKEFCIAADLQAKGHGGIFLGEMEDIMSNDGLCACWLMTDRALPAYKFYCSKGFNDLSQYVLLYKKM